MKKQDLVDNRRGGGGFGRDRGRGWGGGGGPGGNWGRGMNRGGFNRPMPPRSGGMLPPPTRFQPPRMQVCDMMLCEGLLIASDSMLSSVKLLIPLS